MTLKKASQFFSVIFWFIVIPFNLRSLLSLCR